MKIIITKLLCALFIAFNNIDSVLLAGISNSIISLYQPLANTKMNKKDLGSLSILEEVKNNVL